MSSLSGKPLSLHCARSAVLGVLLAFVSGFGGIQAQEQIRVKHILLETQEEAEAVGKEIAAAGGDRKAFTRAARKSSKDPTTRVLGGDLNWISRKSGMDPAFADAAFKLETGKISEPVKSGFGWHLILVTDKRDGPPNRQPAPDPTKLVPTPPTPPAGDAAATPAPSTPTTPTITPPQDRTTSLAPPNTTPVTPANPSTPPDGGTPPAPSTPDAAAPAVEEVKPAPEAKRRTLAPKAFRLVLDSVKAENYFRAPPYGDTEAVEVTITVKNESATEQEFFAPELLALGLQVRERGVFSMLTGDFSSMKEPASFVRKMQTYEVAGMEFSLNDYFKDLKRGSYSVKWDARTFISNLEATFSTVTDLPSYAALKGALSDNKTVRADIILRDFSRNVRFTRRDGLKFAVFDRRLARDAYYYAQIKIQGQADPVVIRLDTKAQYSAANQFANLALGGHYDGLDFFEIQPGEFLMGGDPNRNGTGAPTGTLQNVPNTGNLKHKKGTVSFVTRGTRGPARSSEIGSIFFVCLKERPDWDDQHVPFGEVVAGLDSLEKLDGTSKPRFETVKILTEADYQDAGTNVAANAGDAASPATAGNPEAVIKTTKGDLTVELFEDTSRNTVANFVKLSEDEFYNDNKIYDVVSDEAGKKVAVLTGSPDGTPEGGPDYTIRDEVSNTRKCERGALVMLKRWDDSSGFYEPNSASSQFFICVQPIPYYDSQNSFTVFGRVTGGLENLDNLDKGDAITAVEITKKKDRPYQPRTLPKR